MAVSKKGGDRWLLPLSGILLVMGGLLGVQIRTQSQRSAFQVGRNTSMLGEVLSANREQVEAQKKEIDQWRQKAAAYEKAATSDQGVTKAIQDELQRSRTALGLVPLRGPGIVVKIGDSTRRAGKSDEGPTDLWVVHDRDLIGMVNELWADGAEAIALNGQRIATGSAIVCSGRLVTVNHVAVAAPFVFTVIGNQETLLSALNMRGGIVDELRLLDFQISLTREANVEVPAITVSPKYQFAKPAMKEAQQAAQEVAQR